MNSVLDSPLEALAFNYVSFGLFTVVNNLWTWVAVLTAAVSFLSLRLRASTRAASTAISSSCLFNSPPSNDARSSNGSSPVPEITPSETADEPPCSVLSPVAAPCKFEDDRVVVTKGLKFTLYYEDNAEGRVDLTAEEEEEAEERAGDEAVAEGCGEWLEGILRLRLGEMGWYRHQGLTELNGNVVRLWDGCRVGERHSSSKSTHRVM
ncbi:PREDICTED: transmembrane [Prunus dulcis]|uniref:PREDICTED: transmembrane n=1 Tax=Prunus dulcis TaxID=3755 RepID=A0A5E4E8P0_PRUDU|nr:uncharacterized protein LOC117634689 [Prunus dulcis]VVA10178.1 PREDICTED: transmembrane [Prunus dulcis]